MRKIPFSPPDITEEEIQEVAECLRSGWITTGPRTKQFEKNLSAYFGVNKIVCLNSATAAEELNLLILGLKEGDEVIVPAYTYTASASPAIHCGAKVRLIDSVKDDPEMDYEAVAAAVNEHTKAIIPVDIGGKLCDYDTLYKVVEDKKHLFRAESEVQEKIGRVAVVADSAHAVGSVKDGKSAGQFADFTSFSFHAVKNLTTAEGGCSCWKPLKGISDEEMYKRYQLLSLHGQNKDALAKEKLGGWEYDIVGPWYKCNMTDVVAAIGLKQLERYESLLKRRFEIIDMYSRAMDEMGISYLKHEGENYKTCGHLFLARIPGYDVEKRNLFITKMAEQGVACNVHYKPLPMMTAYKNLGFDIKDFPNAFDYYRNEVTLPLHTLLGDEDVAYVIDTFRKVLGSI